MWLLMPRIVDYVHTGHRRSYAMFYRASKKEGLLGLIFQLAEGLEVDPATFLPLPDGEERGDERRQKDEFNMLKEDSLLNGLTTAERSMHAYTYELFGDTFMSMGTVISAGREQVFCNAPWSRLFFSQEECRDWLGGDQRPTELFGR